MFEFFSKQCLAETTNLLSLLFITNAVPDVMIGLRSLFWFIQNNRPIDVLFIIVLMVYCLFFERKSEARDL